MHDQFVGVVRSTYSLGTDKFGYLDLIPWLFARLLHAGVRDRCVEQYASGDPKNHHRCSHLVLHRDSPLLPSVMALAPDGTGASDDLVAEVDAYRRQPLDETVAEEPHAKANAVGGRTRASTFPWISSTMALDGTLTDTKMLCEPCGANLQSLYSSYKCVIQMKSCLLYTSPSPRDQRGSRMPSSA